MAGRGRILNGLAMLAVASFSLLLLLYVAFGEAERASTEFQVTKLVAQGQIIQNKVEEYLRSGQSLGQFAGFRSIAQPLLDSDPTLTSMVVRDPAAGTLFEAGKVAGESAPLPPLPPFLPSSPGGYQVHRDAAHMHVILPLRNKFETVGSLVVTVPATTATEPVRAAFLPLLPWFAALCLILAVFIFGTNRWPQKRQTRWYRAVFAGAFLMASVAVVWGLVGLYSDGARIKARALADSLDARLNEVIDMGLSIDDFSDIHLAMAEYRDLNPDIGAVAVVDDGVAILHTDRAAQGRPWVNDRLSFEFSSPLHQSRQDTGHMVVMVAMPSDVVYWAVARNVKNFAALFVATGLVALVFLTLTGGRSQTGADDAPVADGRLETIGPVLFVGVFVDNLSASFLPQLVSDSAHAASMPSLAVSGVFLLYFLAFSLSVLPAESFAARRGPKPLIWGGGVLVALGSVLLAVSHGFPLVVLARVLSGCGQGLLLIGVQAYIFSLASPEKRTQGNSIIVFNFNGGMIAGMAIGSLLVLYVDETGVFFLATALMALLALYAVLALPGLNKAALRPAADTSNLWRVLADRRFLECILLVGIPSKALLSGVVIFAMPLLLGKLKYSHEDIGQLIMFYAGGVMVANAMIARMFDHHINTGQLLTRGMILSAAGLAIIGLVGGDIVADVPNKPLVVAGLVLVGVSMLGVAHGFINAPVVTHVTALPIAAAVGSGPVATLYRMVERVGHVAGPVLIGQILLVGHYDLQMMLVPAAAMMILAVAFRLSLTRRTRAA
ncbi:MAG: MFS transporter [Alphaproteobacteria bacterium]|nr:MFS transporter [Alphaproteobacteria bacterium]